MLALLFPISVLMCPIVSASVLLVYYVFILHNILHVTEVLGIVTPYGAMDISIGSGNGLLPDGSKPLPNQC